MPPTVFRWYVAGGGEVLPLPTTAALLLPLLISSSICCCWEVVRGLGLLLPCTSRITDCRDASSKQSSSNSLPSEMEGFAPGWAGRNF